MNYWLIKSEGDCYSIDDFKRDKKTAWTGIRNYQARNFMRAMAKGDQAFFYHTGDEKQIVGIVEIGKTGYVYILDRVTGKPVPADSPTYPFFDEQARLADLNQWFTGGYAISAGTFGFTTIDHVQVAPGSITAFIPIWVQSTGKLALLVPSTGVEVANTTNVSTAIVDVVIFGS